MTADILLDPTLITRQKTLDQLVETLNREPSIAVDTESNSLYAYQERVCLIQFSTPQADYLVDPLALKDLSPLGPVFANPRIEKVFHAAEYDLLCLKRDYGFGFENLFDTMVAARILGWENLGLGSILESEFGVHVDKRNQRANWGQRPLPRDLLAYARLDTHYLLRLSARLKAGLAAKDLLALAAEDFSRMRIVNGKLTEDKVDDCWRINGVHDLTPQQAAVLQELCRYRDKVARAVNRPLFKVINDRTLLAIASECPTSLSDLEYIPGMTRGQVARHGLALLSAVEQGLQARAFMPPRPARPSDQFLDRLEGLRRWRKITAEKMGVSSDVVLPRDLMHLLAEQNPLQPEELHAILQHVPWRLEHFGEAILQELHAANTHGE